MISDSPYELREPVLGPRQGAIAGLLGAVVMLGLIEAWGRIFELPTSPILRQLAFIVLPACRQGCAQPFVTGAGLGVLFSLGALGGLLHAVSQQRIPARGLVVVGIFYGILLWIVGGFLAVPVGGAELKRMIRSWPWFSASLGYGIWLSLVAVWTATRNPLPTRVVVPD